MTLWDEEDNEEENKMERNVPQNPPAAEADAAW